MTTAKRSLSYKDLFWKFWFKVFADSSVQITHRDRFSQKTSKILDDKGEKALRIWQIEATEKVK